MLENLRGELRRKADKEQARNLQRFFKTGKGEYGEGDVFLGISVPETREITEKYELTLEQIQKLLDSEIHEERFAGLLILMKKYKKAGREKNENKKKEIFEFYLKNAEKERINNWDLVDLSCYKIIGDFLINNNREILYGLLNGNLWEKRIAVVSCFAFIKNNDFRDILKIAEFFVENNESHDLIHKSVGWMLREVGKKDEKILRDFLGVHHKNMPRTMLRYAIEKLDDDLREKFLET